MKDNHACILCPLAHLGYCLGFYLEKACIKSCFDVWFYCKKQKGWYALFPPLTQGFYLEKACIKSCFDVWFYCKKQKGWICTVSSPNQIEILNCFNSEKNLVLMLNHHWQEMLSHAPRAFEIFPLTINFLCTNWIYPTMHNWKKWCIIENI